MKKISHSEITTYLDCQKKWELVYKQGLKVDGIHFQFGSMGHKVLETRQIPDELLYPELKETFGIKSWKSYFESIFEELDEFLKDYDILHHEFPIETEELKGVIDLVARHKQTKRILICDYKFSTSVKGLSDISIDEQMYIYAFGYALKEHVSLEDIDICYISIPKAELDKPRLLKNGQLSKDKSQNTTYNKYIEAIEENGLNREDYEDILSELSGRTLLKTVKSDINLQTLKLIMENIDNVIKDMQKGYVLEKCSYMCTRCDFVEYCKYGKEIKKENSEYEY